MVTNLTSFSASASTGAETRVPAVRYAFVGRRGHPGEGCPSRRGRSKGVSRFQHGSGMDTVTAHATGRAMRGANPTREKVRRVAEPNAVE